MIKHVVEGIAELIRHLLNLELFTVNLVLNVINPEVQENITLHNLDYSWFSNKLVSIPVYCFQENNPSYLPSVI